MRNLTPHAVVLLGQIWSEELERWVDDPTPVVLPPAGPVPRVAMTRVAVGRVPAHPGDDVTWVPLYRTSAGEVTDLPPQTTSWLIVSRAVAEACPERGDLLIPDNTVRDEQGRITGCRALASLARPEALEAFLEHRRRMVAPQAAL